MTTKNTTVTATGLRKLAADIAKLPASPESDYQLAKIQGEIRKAENIPVRKEKHPKAYQATSAQDAADRLGSIFSRNK